MNTYNIAVIDPTGLVGSEILDMLAQRNFPVRELRALAPERAAGENIVFNDEEMLVDRLTDNAFDDLDLAFFACDASVSKTFAPQAIKAGTVVIDTSGAFNLDRGVPLIVPEVNSDAIERHRGLLASPACAVIQLVVALHPIHRAAMIRRIVASTYQPVSENGRDAIVELETQTRNIFTQRDILCQVYPHQIAFNCLPHIDAFLETGDTQAEQNLIRETQKILDDDTLRITATAARIPVFYGQSIAINLETDRKMSAQEARGLLAQVSGLKVIDDPANNLYPLATEASGEDHVFVGRIREDSSVDNGLNLWLVTDNLRKGLALNAMQIAETLIDKDWL